MSLPTLTLCVMTHQRPWYAVPTLYGLRERLKYDGARRYLVVDGGSSMAHLGMYEHALRNTEHKLITCRNLADGYNQAALWGGELWLVVLDDYELRKECDVTNDVEFLMRSTYSLGALRYAALSQWGHSIGGGVMAQLEEHGKHLYWVLDKERSAAPHLHIMAAMLYHRSFWDAYGDIPADGDPMPGESELRAANLFNDYPGPTIAIPMRFGDTGPFCHIGYVRSEDYSERCGDAWGAIDVFDDARVGNVREA